MNYCLDFSIRVEDELLRLTADKAREKECETSDLTIEEEFELYNTARETIVSQDEGRTLAGGNVRIGEIILLIDSDTRVVSFSQTSNYQGHQTTNVIIARGLSLEWRSRDARES